MYKLIYDDIVNIYCIQRKSDNAFIPPVSENRDYLQFVEDIYRKGIEIVEGADVETQISYVEARVAEYPPIEDQLDKIYHSGIDAWKADIKTIKDKYPKTQVGITSIAPIPDWVNTALFEKQKEKYLEAKARLAQYELSVGLQDENNNYIIEPLPRYLEEVGINPLIVQDEAEREAAQKIINETPQSVIDSINN